MLFFIKKELLGIAAWLHLVIYVIWGNYKANHKGNAKDFCGEYKAKYKGKPKDFKGQCKGKHKGNAKDSRWNTQLSTREVLRIFEEIQGKIQRKC